MSIRRMAKFPDSPKHRPIPMDSLYISEQIDTLKPMPQFKIAAVNTCFYPYSHADVILSRWFVKRPTDPAWGWNGPESRVISLYTDQCPDNDMSRSFAKDNNLPIYDTVANALCAGGSKLAVDGVMLIGEHGNYPKTEYGAIEYPRKALFDQIVQVFRDSGRCVPVFCDKHYTWRFDWAQEMVRTAKDMGFLLFGGSSIPLCPRKPQIALTGADRLTEAVEVFYSCREIYGYHSIEFVQAVIEGRAGGESGVESITAYTRDQFDQALAAHPRFEELFRTAISAYPRKTTGDYRENCAKTDFAPEAFLVQYRDGVPLLHANLTGHIEGWGIAMSLKDRPNIVATGPLEGGKPDHYGHFAALSRVIEGGLMNGRCDYPVERNLLTTGITAAMMQAFSQPGIPLPTPELADCAY
jgi:hypothetical protein